MNLADFKARLRDGNIGGWYILSGEEEYLKRYYRQELKKIAAPDDAFAAFNHVIFDGADMDIASLREAIYSPPMMADYKFIEWRHAEPDKLREGELKLLGLNNHVCLQDGLKVGEKLFLGGKENTEGGCALL